MSKEYDFSWSESTFQELEDIIAENADYFEIEYVKDDCYLDLKSIDEIKSVESYHLED